MAKRVSSEDFEAEVLGSDLPVVVEFYSDSCIPCKQLSPVSYTHLTLPTILLV